MVRKAIIRQIQNGNQQFRLRGHEIKRIEAFSDAVFAFAVTLLIVSLEVPKSFEELLTTMRGFFAFGISFLFLMLVWYEQNVFFRRYALDDITVIALNGCLLFIVLFFVYPLKFLFLLVFNNATPGSTSVVEIELQQVPVLMCIYAAGYIAIYILFFLMYAHAGRKKEELELTPVELFDTKTRMWAQLILVCIGVLSIIVAELLPPEKAGLAGFVFFLIGPAFTVYYSIRSKKRNRISKESTIA